MMKDTYKPTNSFINSAWKDMEARLDVELPQSKRRPFYWLWFGLSLLFLTIAITFMSKDASGEEKMQPIAPASIAPVAEAAVKGLEKRQAQPKADAKSEHILIAASEKQGTAKKQSRVLSKNTTAEIVNRKEPSPTETATRQATTNTTLGTAFANKSIQHDSKNTALEKKVQVADNQSIKRISPFNSTVHTATSVSSLATLASRTQPLDFFPSFSANSATPTRYGAVIRPAQTIPSRRLACGFGMTYGAIDERGNTWSFGGEVDLIFKERFAITANMAYRHRQYRNSQGQFLYIQEQDLTQATGLDASSISTFELNYVAPELIAFQVNQIESLEFGLHPSVRVYEKLWLEARFSGIRSKSVATKEQRSLNSFMSDNVSSVVEDAFTDWDILYGGGLRYQFNKHVGMNLRVQKVFQPGSLRNKAEFDRQTANGLSFDNSLPLIAQPMFFEMGIAFRL